MTANRQTMSSKTPAYTHRVREFHDSHPTEDEHCHPSRIDLGSTSLCSLHSSVKASPCPSNPYNYAQERALLQLRTQSPQSQSFIGSFTSLASATPSVTSDYASNCSDLVYKRPRKVPNCRSPRTPLLDPHPSFEDCDSVWEGSVSGSSGSSYNDFDRTSLLSGIANLELDSPNYHYAPSHSPLPNPRLAQFHNSRTGYVRSQPSSPRLRHNFHEEQQIVKSHCHRDMEMISHSTVETEETVGCCSIIEPKQTKDFEVKEPVVSTYMKGFMSWMSSKAEKGTTALMDVLPSFSKEDFHLVMIGLDGAGKTTALYRMKLDQYLNTVPTIGFNCERVAGTIGRSSGLTFLVWDVGGQEKIRPLWRSYTRCTDGIIFVLDSADHHMLEEARMELHRTVSYQDNKDIPLLILANKQDLPRAISKEEIIEALELRSLQSSLWSVELACSITGEGLDTGVEMMYSMIMKRKMRAKRNRNKTR
eukprot:TRINITY_DN17180_c0_g1_i4.p1 TRINITY_DN17180_c0_g1~~TRINITY_DN17180_c0_g1_i4.p1  ORF type:complete len:476 (-),score=82.53 TRINITY_DN17180_c0_g1_i4:299-1726(-)